MAYSPGGSTTNCASGAVPALTRTVLRMNSPGSSLRWVMTARQANPPPAGVTGCPVRESVKYGSTSQLLGNVRSTAAWLMFSTRMPNTRVSPLNVGFGATVTRTGAGDGAEGEDPQPPASAAATKTPVMRVIESPSCHHFSPSATFSAFAGSPLQ